jgi:hypothetical protein
MSRASYRGGARGFGRQRRHCAGAGLRGFPLVSNQRCRNQPDDLDASRCRSPGTTSSARLRCGSEYLNLNPNPPG